MIPVEVNRSAVFLKAVCGRCPRCDSQDLFRDHYRLHERCPCCGLPFDQEDGFSLGAVPLNYSLTVMVWVLPLSLAFLFGWLSLPVAGTLAGIGVLVIPFLTYRHSKRLWLGLYYAILPNELEFADSRQAPNLVAKE